MFIPEVMSNKKYLIISIIFGILASLAGYNYLMHLETQITDARSHAEVLIANEDIKQNTKITGDMLKLSKRPANTILSDALVNPHEAIGKISTTDLIEGEQIVASRIDSDLFRDSFTKQIEDGYRAVTVQVNDDSTFSGLLEPGDRIDIIGTFDDYMQGSRDVSTFIENVRVLAVGDNFLRNAQKAKGTTDDGLLSWNMQPDTVTLSLKPTDAETVVLLERYGHMKFVLRAGSDSSEKKDETIVQGEAVQEEQEEEDGMIRIIRGTKTEEVQIY